MANIPFIEQARRLAEHLAASNPSRLKHHEILAAVAAMNGADNWDHLCKKPTDERRGFVFGRKKHYAERVHTIDELKYAVNFNTLQLGNTFDDTREVHITNAATLCHALIFASNGYGARTLLEHLMVQQVARGGGLLVVDPLPDPQPVATVRRAALACGRADEFYEVAIGAEAPADSTLTMTALLDRGALLYAQYPTFKDELPHGAAVTLLDEFWERFSTQKKRPAVPFMVVVPLARLLLDRKWPGRFAHARALGVSIILQDDSIPLFQRVGAEIAENVLSNTFTKIFFRQPSADGLDSAARFIDTQVAYSQGRELHPAGVHRDWTATREKLVNLTLGEALVLSGAELTPTRVCMVKT